MECFSLVFDNMIIKLDSSMVNILVQPLTCTCTSKDFLFNPLQPSVAFLYPLKTSENQRFSDIFRGYWKRPVAWNRLTWLGDILFTLMHEENIMTFDVRSNFISHMMTNITQLSNELTVFIFCFDFLLESKILLQITHGRPFWYH